MDARPELRGHRAGDERVQKINYQKVLDGTLASLGGGTPPKLLLHACCAPCSSYVLEYLSQYFKIILFYYNPNISPEEEYRKRAAEVRRLLSQLPVKYPVTPAEGKYDPQRFFDMARGLENEREGGARCARCYELRLREAAAEAKERGADWFATTLTVSPYKHADTLNEIGAKLEREFGVRWLPSDFKKRGGYQRSIELSHRYGLYRQNYCGCVFSQRDAPAAEPAKDFKDIASHALSWENARPAVGDNCVQAQPAPAVDAAERRERGQK